MFNRPAILLLVVGLTGASALSETFPTTFSTVLRRNPTPGTRSNTDPISGRDVDPATCPTVECAAGFRPVYQEGSKHCSCIELSAPCSNSIYCGAGCHSVTQPFRDTCACEPDAGTETCPMMKCKADHHVVYHNETADCSCASDCPDLFCIAEMHPVYNSSTHACSCQAIPGLSARLKVTALPQDIASALSLAAEQFSSKTTLKVPYTGPPTKRQELATATRAFLTTSVVPRPTTLPVPSLSCQRMICISEMHPVYNSTTGSCSCQYIPDLEPGGPMLSARDKIPTFTTSITRSPKQTSCPEHNAMCEVGKQPGWNAKSGKCECQSFPTHETPPSLTTMALPTATGGSCEDVYCIAEKTPVWNAAAGGCSYEWIEGFGPARLS
ncbi:uncharacterized protein PAC_10999 [Phialocephala subalpina]|uniref:EGF-like domain-containing protein n=1 Tax=Phialocephala subalpina TaxID=576137 RepID=A0A1L7X7V9_9HELO|nr:uncharacterized protein PAC_10999 [Phialocephala subalpina]